MEIKLNHGEIINVSEITSISSFHNKTSLLKQRAGWHRCARKNIRKYTRAIAFNSEWGIVISDGIQLYTEYHPSIEHVNNRINELWKLFSTAE